MPPLPDNDLGVFFDTDEFALSVTVKATAVTAIFDHEYVAVENIEGERPVLTCRTSDLPAGLVNGDPVVVEGVDYTVASIHPDGTGVTLLVLREA